MLRGVPKWEQFIVQDVMGFEKGMEEKGSKGFLEYVKKMSNESNAAKEKGKVKSVLVPAGKEEEEV